MSVANYDASSYNHAEILICIQTVGTLQESDLMEAFSKIRKHSKLTIPDAGRTLRFRFELAASPENSKWGFFQPHRRVMGLLVLASCSTAMEVALLHETFQKQKDAFSDFIFDARCFVFGVENTLTQQSKTDVFQFVNMKSWKSSDNDITQFLTSVFYVLESKRLQMAADKSDRPPLLTAPFEKKQQSSSDSDSRSYRKKCLGRWKKHLADICLLAGLKLEALQNYTLSLDYLLAVNDPVWVGGALEGLCVTSAIALFGSAKSSSKPSTDMASSKQVLDPRALVSTKQGSAELNKLCIQTSNEFVEQYKEAVINYSRNENMGIVELEACIKATKVMAVMHKFIQAAEFLQNAVYIALNVSDQERITKYSVLADLYAEINFHRKSAFYRRVAAMQCVAPHLQQPDWKKCYGLLKGTFLGYELDLLNDSGLPLPPRRKEKMLGWPQVKIRVLHELVFSARKNGRMKLANRYCLYILMRLHHYLNEAEEKDACAALTSSRREESTRFPDEMSLPSVDLYSLPTVCDVEPQPLPEALQPTRIRPIQSSSVFLFTPSSYQSEKKKLKHIDFKWSVNSTAQVQVEIFNPLRFHCMRVNDMRLICEGKGGATFECHTLSMDVPPGEIVKSSLEILPKSEGTIVITGYKATVFGERSKCYFRNMPWIPVDELEIDVIVELPILQRGNSCLSPDANSKNRMTIMLYRGETRLLEVPFANLRGPVSLVQLTPKPPTLAAEETSFSSCRQRSLWLQVSCDDIQNQLPLDSGGSLLLPVIMMTESKFDNANNKYPVCSCQIQLQYSNESGNAANWCRNSSVQVMASMKPCIIIKNISTMRSNRQGYCVIFVELHDVSEDDVIVCSAKLSPENMLVCAEDKLEYEGDSLVLAELSPDDTISIEVVLPTVNMQCRGVENEKNEDASKLQENLSDNLALEWIIKDESSSRTGVLDLSSYKLDSCSVDNLLTPPLLWKLQKSFNNILQQNFYGNTYYVSLIYIPTYNFAVDKKTITFAVTMHVDDDIIDGRTTDCDVGTPVAVKVNMKNISADTIALIDVEIEVFQDQENGFREWNMEDNVLYAGCQRQSFHNVKANEVVEFHCILIFLLCGQYHVRLRRLFSEPVSEPDDTKRLATGQNRLELGSYKQFSPEFKICAAQT